MSSLPRPRTSSQFSSPVELPQRAEGSALTRMSRCSRKPRLDTRRFSMPASLFDSNFMSIPPAVLAAQLTLLDLPLFQAIPRKELLACQWTCKLKQNVSPHIVAFIAHFNQVCYWLVREVLSTQELRARSERMVYIIHLAEAMHDLNNINGLKAAMSALSSQPVFRLSASWEMVGKKEHATYARLSNLLAEDNNKAMLRALMETISRPCIPFLGMYLTDLLFLNTARQGQGGAPNSERMESMVDELSVMQCSAYDDLNPSPQVQSYIQSHRYLDEMLMFEEDQHYRMSLDLEPKLVRQQSVSSSPAACSPAASVSDLPGTRIQGSRSAVMPCPPPRDNGVSLSRSLSLEHPHIFNHHRRSRSNCEPSDKKDFLFSLSVIAPEASSGPRHLIDGSLMCSSLSVGSVTSTYCSSVSSDTPSDLIPEDTHVVGVAVRCSESDDDSETLLQNGLGDSDDMNDSFDSTISHGNGAGGVNSCWGQPVISGVVQVRKASAKQRDLSDSPKFRTLQARSSGTSFTRSWRSATASVCGEQLIFSAAPSSKSAKRRNSQQQLGNPFCVIDLDSDATLLMDKSRVFVISRPLERSIQVKLQSDSERDDWTSVIRGIITKPTVVVYEPAPPLIDFDAEPLCSP